MSAKGILLFVARATLGDCTNGGVSADHDKLTMIGTITDFDRVVVPLPEKHKGPFAPNGFAPAVALHLRSIGGEIIPSIVPVDVNIHTGKWERPEWTMAGGNYATGDSRLSDLISDASGHSFYGAVAIHDRIE